MPEDKKFKYEVAFSFLQQDEAIALQINDLLQDKFSTFLYSKKQEQLVGTDGEKKFNEVFFKESRIVVLLYRKGWGDTPWTRIEQIAISNRAFQFGWDFLLLVNLNKDSPLPAWIPKVYVWHDYQRWKCEGLAPVIEYKIKETGGVVSVESIEDRANRLNRLRAAVRERQVFFNSGEAINESSNEAEKIFNILKKSRRGLEKPEEYFILKEDDRDKEMYEFGHKRYFLCFVWIAHYAVATEKHMKALIYKKPEFEYDFRNEVIIAQTKYYYERDLMGNNMWSDKTNSFTSEALVTLWIKKFLDILDTNERKEF